MRKASKKPNLREGKKGAFVVIGKSTEKVIEPHERVYLTDLINETPGSLGNLKIHTNYYTELGLEQGDEIYCELGAQPKPGELIIERYDHDGKRYAKPAIYKPRLQLAAESGVKADTFKPFPEIIGVARYIIKPISGGIQ